MARTHHPTRGIAALTMAALVLALALSLPAAAQGTHPHLLVTPPDRQAILDKIHTEPWVDSIFKNMVNRVKPYVERHQRDPQWILSRYLMNRVAGKRYTRFYSDPQGTRLTGYGGDAPYPTVRVSPHKRAPITADGYGFRVPSIGELVPYDTATRMHLQTTGPGHSWEWVKPQSFVGTINGEINELVLDAAIVYWLTGQKAYGTFAADILSQWARGAFYQQPVAGPCRTGFLHIQSLGDDHTVPMILAYDFLYDFLRGNGYDTHWYETVFDKIASTMVFRGFWHNNWFAAQTPALVFAALSLQDKKKRDYYLNFYLRKDTIRGSCGQLALPSLVEKWLTPDGHWKETGGYHNYAIGNLLVSALAMERNGYPVFEKFPALFEASYVLLKYCFPNLKNPAFGDNGGRPSQSPVSLEIALLMAKKYGRTALLGQLMAAMRLLIRDNHYSRASAGYLGLLCFLPELPGGNAQGYTWPRSGTLGYAHLFLQRNGTDSLHGLMYVVQGGTYNHNHANGMAMELYGAGSVMGADPGSGLSYDGPLHVHYYAEWAAHNTVVADARSGPVPAFHGGGGAKRIGHISLDAMEPLPARRAVSPYCSFTRTRYTDIATSSAERRTMAIVRTSDTSGYYVDIYRCSGSRSNAYLYHNIGDTVELFTSGRQPLLLRPAVFPMSRDPHDPPGFSALKDYRSTGNRDSGIIARFSLAENRGAPTFMQVLMPGEKGRTYYTASAPRTRTAPAAYRSMPTPVLICRQQGQAWTRPFVAVYEPYAGKGHYQVQAVSLRSSSRGFTALRVRSKDQSTQLILEAADSTKRYSGHRWSFRGDFGVIGSSAGRTAYLYLGKGEQISSGSITVSVPGSCGSANLLLAEDGWRISCDQDTRISVRGKTARQILLSADSKEQRLAVIRTAGGITFTVPPVTGAHLRIIP
jgi:hypothetical protein